MGDPAPGRSGHRTHGADDSRSDRQSHQPSHPVAASTHALWNERATLAEFDTVLSALVAIATVAACYNLAKGRSRSTWVIWALAYTALTAGFLAKGMLALMAFAPGLICAAFVTRQSSQLWSRSHLVAAAMSAAAISIYLALVWTHSGHEAFAQPLAEAQQRGFTWDLATAAKTFAKPIGIFAGFLPWSIAWFWGFRAHREGELHSSSARRLQRAGAAFLVTGVVVFMAVPTFESRYYLPLTGAAGILAAFGLERLQRPSALASRLSLGFGVVAGLATLAMAFHPSAPDISRIVVVVVGLAALVALWRLHRSTPRHRIALVLLVVALCAWTCEAWVLRPHRARSRVLDWVAAEFDPLVPSDAPVWTNDVADKVGKNSSLYYYLGREVRTFHSGPELPQMGSWVIMTSVEHDRFRAHYPSEAERLRLVRYVDHRWWDFLLLQVDAAPEDL